MPPRRCVAVAFAAFVTGLSPSAHADESAPSDAKLEQARHRSTALMIAGGSIFGTAYGLTAITAIGSTGPSTLYVPVAGPILELVRFERELAGCRAEGCGYGRLLAIAYYPALVVDALVQATGVALLATGIAIRPDSDSPTRGGGSIQPYLTGTTAGVFGTF